MRIIGGVARGKTLLAPQGMETRPTADRIREALFNLLMADVPGARVLDLFGGSGALSAEALSRGAQFTLCVDVSSAACAVIRVNLDLKGVTGASRVVCADWRDAIAAHFEPFDIVFLDPPYRMTELYGEAFRALDSRGLLAPDAIVVFEMAADASVPLPAGAEAVKDRRYGATRLQLIRSTRGKAST